MTIVNQKPAYWVTVRDNFWSFLIAEQGAGRMYEPTIYRSPVVKSIGLKKSTNENSIYASGIVYDYSRQVQGGEISLEAVALDHVLLDKATGAENVDGFVYDSSGDVTKEFAFGYYMEQRDSGYVYYWHPRCLLTADDESVETSTDNAPDPKQSYTIKALPTSEGVWRTRYYTKDADGTPLTPEEFFSYVRYSKLPQAAAVTLGTAKVGTACSATVTYADGASPSSPTVVYSWLIGDSADGDFAEISGATSASYTPVAGNATKYIKCRAAVSGSAVGYVESAAALVAAAGA